MMLFRVGTHLITTTLVVAVAAANVRAAGDPEPPGQDDIEVISWEVCAGGFFGERNRLTLWADGRSEVRISRPCMATPYLVVAGWEEVSRLEFVRRFEASSEGRKQFLAAVTAEPHLLRPAVVHTTDCGGFNVELSGKGKTWRLSTSWDSSTDNDPDNYRRWTALDSIMGKLDDQHPFLILPKSWSVPMSPIELREASIRASQRQ